MKKDKRFIIEIIIIIAIIVAGVLYFVIPKIYEDKYSLYVDSTSRYSCEYSTQIEEGNSKFKQLIVFDSTGEITRVGNSIIYTYDNLEKYSIMKDHFLSMENNVSYDDKELSVTIVRTDSNLVNSNNDPIVFWINDYISGLTDNGYKCSFTN